MIHGEARFFTNWQMSKEVSSALHQTLKDADVCDEAGTYNEILAHWLETTKIYDRIHDNRKIEEKKEIINQFTRNNFMFCEKCHLPEDKMVVVMEILHYLMRQMLDMGEGLTEQQSYDNFKELLLRHAIHRPPHSLALLNMEDVRKIDLFVQDSFFRHFDMYKYSLVYKDELKLSTTQTFSFYNPGKKLLGPLKSENTMPARFSEIKDLQDYFSEEEQLAIQKELDFLASPEGRA